MALAPPDSWPWLYARLWWRDPGCTAMLLLVWWAQWGGGAGDEGLEAAEAPPVR